MLAYDLAQTHNGTFLLRIEDIDQARARDAWENQIYEDLAWLGLTWPTPVVRQSENMPAYAAALEHLGALGVLYGCTCTRRDIQAALSAPQEGVETAMGPDGLIYPGTCRTNAWKSDNPSVAIRLDMARAVDVIKAHNDDISFIELGSGHEERIEIDLAAAPATIGDIVVARRDMGTSYHLSVVVDDHNQQISHVVRGKDLFEATAIHVILQKLLGYDTPKYLHHALIRDDEGKRLAKRDDARALALFRSEGKTPEDIRKMVGL